jgi:alpha-D-ribose 1-methylphosphonate 5-triphosphate synthase subunit PhnG
MFHSFDGSAFGDGRAGTIALLARAPLELLETAVAAHAVESVQWLRKPETGLMMVQGRVGATGEKFNLGEVTVTRCALRVPSGSAAPDLVGVAYVLGRSHKKARLSAMADALLQDINRQESLEATLLEPVRERLKTMAAAQQARAQSTKVEFFTIAREAADAAEEEVE